MSNFSHRIRAFLKQHQLQLNTDLGQHYLIDPQILDQITQAAHLIASDHIVEIGPGIGVLTKQLLAAANHVTAIELDDRVIPLLEKYVQEEGKRAKEDGQRATLTIINGNALNTPVPSEPYKIVANIPYHITSPLLRHVFLESEQAPESLTLLIQKEVADRICDRENAGLLTIIVGLFGHAELICPVPPTAFLPPPKVDSAVIHIECYPEPVADTATLEQIFKLTKIAFSQKRKMLSNTFKTFPGGMELLKAAAIDPSRRPQTLSIEEWVALGRAAQAA